MHAIGGSSLAEVLLATMIIAIALVPALDALQSGLMAGAIHGDRVSDHYTVTGRLEDVLAEPFDDLDAAALAAGGASTPSSYSDAPAASPRRLVYIARYDGDDADGDGDPLTGGDEDILWVKVELETYGSPREALTIR